MKKIGIITWYHYRNYGTALQASALDYVIKKLGYYPIMINYKPRKIYTNRLTFLELFKKAIIVFKNKTNEKYFSEQVEDLYKEYLSKRIEETKPCNTYSELYQLNNEIDAFVCGSDQIWSPNNFDDKYLLSFVSEPSRKVAYAPSIGLARIENTFVKEKVGELLKSFGHLSIREKQGASLLKEYYSLDVKVVLDPTLLLRPRDWIEYANIEEIEKKIPDEKYIICYFLGNERHYISAVKKIAKELSAKVYVIPVYRKSCFESIPFEAGPREFIALIKNANYVCTDSFHGMAFAINFNIPFTVFLRFREKDPLNQNSRVVSLLEQLKLSERIYSVKSWIKDIDFSISNRILEEKRRQSKIYLENSLKEAVNAIHDEQKNKKFEITKLCCGCGSCASICPTQAIKFQRDKEGFQHYIIDEDKCIKCKKCQTICPFDSIDASDIGDLKELYSFKSNSLEVLKKSSSGGASHEILRYLQGENYQICGSVYDKDKQIAVHKFLERNESLDCFQGSKYLQSESMDVMHQIYHLGNSDKFVFTGTPCQVAGVHNLLKEKGCRQQAVLVDLICHGVPSYYLWSRYLSEMKRKYHFEKNPEVVFRDKEKGKWRKLTIRLFENPKSSKSHQYVKNEDIDPFYIFFKNNTCNMLSCYECPYRNKSSADIRLGDYWGKRFRKDKTGVSMVIPITLKGKGILEMIKQENKASIRKWDITDFYEGQYPYNMPQPYFRNELIKQLKHGAKISYLKKQYCTGYIIQEKLIQIQNKLKL